MALLRRRLRCHYCNTLSQDVISQIPKTYFCRNCDSVNYFDERGEITDPPVQDFVAEPASSFRYRYSRSPSPAPVMPPVSDDLFCNTCQHNQTLMANILAEYLPDEDDPEYNKFAASYDAYRKELEDRYPQVCADCLPRVQEQIRKAGYAAKSDQLRRMMEKSQEKRKTVQTPRLTWTLRFITLAKWTYISGTVIGILWHAFALMVAADKEFLGEESVGWDFCLSQALHIRTVGENCVMSPGRIKLVEYTLAADLLTLWWNPKLEVKAKSLTGRMHGLISLRLVRAAVLSLRFASLHYWKRATIDSETISSFHRTQLLILGALVLSIVLTWKSVRVVYHPSSSLHRSVEENLPSIPNSAEKARKGSYHPAHQQPNIFDGMAQAFTTGFDDESTALPPSPTLTASSYTTNYTDATTPYTTKSRNFSIDDSMDWTPTQRRFAQRTPEVLSSQWSENDDVSASPQHHTRELHSLFSKPDTNPFHQKVPAAPKAPAHATVNPWKPGVWDPPLKDTMPNFFQQEQRERQRSQSPDKGLRGIGVPKDVQRNAEMFASPKMKYDNYGTLKDTGLEDTFNGLFSQ